MLKDPRAAKVTAECPVSGLPVIYQKPKARDSIGKYLDECIGDFACIQTIPAERAMRKSLASKFL